MTLEFSNPHFDKGPGSRRLRDIAAAAGSAVDLDVVLRHLYQAVLEVSGFDRVGLWLNDGTNLQGTWGTGANRITRDEKHLRFAQEDFTESLMDVLEGRVPYVISDAPLLLNPVNGPSPSEHLPLFCAIGIRFGATTIGVLFLNNRDSLSPIMADEISPLIGFVEQISYAIQNAQLIGKLKRTTEIQRRLVLLTSALASEQDYDAVLRMIRDAVLECGLFDRSGVWVCDGEYTNGSWGTDFEGNAIDEHSDRQLKTKWGPAVQPLFSGEKDLAFDIWSNVDVEGYGFVTTYPHVVVALRAGSETVGVLSVDNLLTHRPIDDSDIDALIALAQCGAAAMRSAQLRLERTNTLRRITRLTQISAALNASMSIWDLLLLVHNDLVEAGGFDRCGLYVYDSDTGIVQGAWGTSREGKLEDMRDFRAPYQQFFDVANRGEDPDQFSLTVTQDFTADHQLTEDNPMYGVRHHAEAPISANGHLLGIVSVDNLLTDRPITAGDIEVLHSFTEQAGAAIQNARLYQQLHATKAMLSSSEKLRALGQLAGGVAHSLNNLLTAIMGYSDMIQLAEDTPEKVRRYGAVITKASVSAAEIVRRMQQFAFVGSADEKAACNLSEIASDTLEEILRQSRRTEGADNTLNIVTHFSTNIMVRCHATELQEAIGNLVTNALEAMPVGGTLTLRTSIDSAYGMLVVHDTGLGLNEDVQKQMFEPFFTTKGPSIGLGLGLSVTWSIATRNGGSLEGSSEVGAGTKFTLKLPLDT